MAARSTARPGLAGTRLADVDRGRPRFLRSTAAPGLAGARPDRPRRTPPETCPTGRRLAAPDTAGSMHRTCVSRVMHRIPLAS